MRVRSTRHPQILVNCNDSLRDWRDERSRGLLWLRCRCARSAPAVPPGQPRTEYQGAETITYRRAILMSEKNEFLRAALAEVEDDSPRIGNGAHSPFGARREFHIGDRPARMLEVPVIHTTECAGTDIDAVVSPKDAFARIELGIMPGIGRHWRRGKPTTNDRACDQVVSDEKLVRAVENERVVFERDKAPLVPTRSGRALPTHQSLRDCDAPLSRNEAVE